MTDRERWTVYPLLFLALGISLKDKLTKVVTVDELRCERVICSESVRSKNVSCNAFVATDAKSEQQVTLTAGEIHCRGLACQELLVADPKSKQQVRATGGEIACRDLRAPAVICNALEVLDAEGKPAVQAASNAEGGFVTLTGTKNQVKTYLGNTDQLAGLLFFDQKGQAHLGAGFPLPVPGQLAPKPKPQEKPDETPGAETPADEKPPADESDAE